MDPAQRTRRRRREGPRLRARDLVALLADGGCAEPALRHERRREHLDQNRRHSVAFRLAEEGGEHTAVGRIGRDRGDLLRRRSRLRAARRGCERRGGAKQGAQEKDGKGITRSEIHVESSRRRRPSPPAMSSLRR
jgi:hypothetical protein